MTRMRVHRVVPGSIGIEPHIRSFLKKKTDGYLTAYSDAALPLLREFVPDDELVEVRPFGEIVRMVLEMCGEPTLRISGSIETTAALAQAVRELDPGSPFYESSRFTGFHEAVGRTLGELHEWEIDTAEMEILAESATPRLAGKLRNLALLDREKDRILAELGREPHSAQLRNCFGCTPERDGAIERLFVLTGPEESPLKTRWLRWMAEQGTEVTVIVDRHATDAPIFARAGRTLEQLQTPATSSGDSTLLSNNLFRQVADQGGPDLDDNDPKHKGVSAFTAADSLAECEAALRACANEIESSAIFVRNLADYAPLLEAAAKRFRIPLRMSRRAPLLTNSLIRLTLSALEFCAGNDVRKLRTILHSSYLGLTGEQQNQLESALRDAHSMRTLQWDTLKMWANSVVEEFPWVNELLAWRSNAVAEKRSLREWKPLLDELIEHREMPWHLRREGTDEAMGERDRRARNQLQRLLASHISVETMVRERPMDLAEFVRYCTQLLQGADVSIPTSDTGILVTDTVENLGRAKRLHVLGMLEGVFPRRRSEDPILTDDERAEISALRPDGPILPTSHDKAAAERDVFYRVCAAARRTLVFSFPRSDDERDNIEAFYLTEVARALGLERRESLFSEPIPRLNLAPELDKCVYEADRQLRIAQDGPRSTVDFPELQVTAAKEVILPDPDHGFHPSELRDVLRCPFQYAFQHRLKLNSRRRASRWQNLRKLPQAAGLVAQPNRERAESALIAALDAELDSLYSVVDDWELPLLRSGGKRLIRDWVRREFAARKIWPREQGTVETNVHFGDSVLRKEMPSGVTLEGVVPAVSCINGYRVIHLYRSNPLDPKEMTEPEQLLVGLYLLSIYRTAPEVAVEFDDVSGKRELVVLTRQGELPGNTGERLSVVNLATTDDKAIAHKNFFENVRKSLRRAADRIHEARIDPMKGQHCHFCDYGELCRRAQDFGEEDSPFGEDIILRG